MSLLSPPRPLPFPSLRPVQLLDFLDVLDDAVLGYLPPTVITILHTHLFSCAVDYRCHAGGWGTQGQGPALHVRNLLQPKSPPQAPLPPCACPYHC